MNDIDKDQTENQLDFSLLVDVIQQVNREFTSQASRAVNISLTLRNWCIGAYIHEYELNGSDRAEYGEKLLENLSVDLKSGGVKATGKRQLYNYRRFYLCYPQIVRSLTAQFQLPYFQTIAENEKVRPTTAQFQLDPQKLLNSLSYTHFELIFPIEDGTKRAFYELEAIRGGWSVKELKRQINSLYYERSGLSEDKDKLAEVEKLSALRSELTCVKRSFLFLNHFPLVENRHAAIKLQLTEPVTPRLLEYADQNGSSFFYEVA